MANSFEIIDYKQKIASMLINNEDIVRLINNTYIESPEELIGKNIFNFMRYPDSVEHEITYICFEVEVPKISNTNYLFKQLVITFYVITHERLMPTDDPKGGTRNDLLQAHIDEIFNDFKGIGKTPLELVSNIADAISVKHRRRILTFATVDSNDNKCKQ